jgi:hypothetical protein
MQEHLRRLPLLGSRVLMLCPEDVLAHKALLALADATPGKHHRGDIEAITRVQGGKLDLPYLVERLAVCQAREIARPLFAEVGITV